MKNISSFIAIIPARTGSKRLLSKNKLNLTGKPLIRWTIEAALKSKFSLEVLVSTDDLEIAEISKCSGAQVPFIRPSELSTDSATSFEVVKHALEFYKTNLQKEFEYLILLQPTSPCRDANNVNESIELLRKKNADAIISVCKTEHSPLWSNTLPDDLSMKNFLSSKISNTLSQKLPAYYRLNGAIYICNINRFLKEKTFFIHDNIFAYLMSNENSIDIDTKIDFTAAEILLKEKNYQ